MLDLLSEMGFIDCQGILSTLIGIYQPFFQDIDRLSKED